MHLFAVTAALASRITSYMAFRAALPDLSTYDATQTRSASSNVVLKYVSIDPQRKREAALPNQQGSDDGSFDPYRGRRKEDVVVTEKYAPKEYTYDVFFFGLDIRPKSLWHKTMGHHIIGALDTVLCPAALQRTGGCTIS